MFTPVRGVRLKRFFYLCGIINQSEDGSDLGIYVKAVAPGGGASRARCLGGAVGEDGVSRDRSPLHPAIAPGDRIIAVNGQKTRGLSQEATARLVSLAGTEVRLTLARNLGLGCVAAAVPARDLRKRNGKAVSRSNTSASFPVPSTVRFSLTLFSIINFLISM